MISLKRYNVMLDSEKVKAVKKSGHELSPFLRLCMVEKDVSLIGGVKVEGSATEKLSKKVESLEAKNLKMDIEFKEAQNKFNAAYRRIFNAMRRMGLEV